MRIPSSLRSNAHSGPEKRSCVNVAAAIANLSDTLTPSPLPRSALGTASDHFAMRICGWAEIAAEKPAGVDGWSLRHLDKLVALESQAPAAVEGKTLVHFDVRADNLLLTDDQAWFVDWPHARVGAPWLDLVQFAPSVAMQGGPDPESLVRRNPAAEPASRDALTAAVASITGFFIRESLLIPPPGLPTLRPFQAAQGQAALEWLRTLTRWD
jgi:aminoglycoside phosphotransferase (APT) family kinase protein